ncbi:hypothetical protein JCM19000A_25470 [Silvimonas sp. JCM 19000]
MRAARLRHRISIQRKTITRSPSGEQLHEWQEIASVRAGVEPLRGSERIADGQVRASVDTLIVIRYQRGLKVGADDRVVHGDDIYNVASAIDVRGEHDTIEIMATANGVSDG